MTAPVKVPADALVFAHCVRRARVFGALEGRASARRGISLESRYGKFTAMIGVDSLDAHQERACFRAFHEAFADSWDAWLRANPPTLALDDEQPTVVDPPPVRRKGVRRFLYALKGRG